MADQILILIKRLSVEFWILSGIFFGNELKFYLMIIVYFERDTFDSGTNELFVDTP